MRWKQVKEDLGGDMECVDAVVSTKSVFSRPQRCSCTTFHLQNLCRKQPGVSAQEHCDCNVTRLEYCRRTCGLCAHIPAL